MKIESGIYCIQNTINNKSYIGSSINVYKRRNKHFSELKNNKHKNIKLQSSFNIHTKDNFIFFVIELVDDKQKLIEREKYYIDKLKPFYNINLIANSSLGIKRSEETKEKIRQTNLGLKHPEWRNKIKSESQGGDKHWTKNKNFSQESKDKMSESQKKLYENGYQHPRLGVKEDEEIINAKRKRASKPILMFDLNGNLIKEFSSIKEAYTKCGYSQSLIGLCCRLKKEKYLGHVWKFKEQTINNIND